MLDYHYTFEDCYVLLEGHTLKIGNKTFERTWSVKEDIPTVISLLNKVTNKEWFTVEDTHDWLTNVNQKYAFYHSSFIYGERSSLTVEAKLDDDCGIAKEHLRVEVCLAYKDCAVRWIHIVYPASPLIRSFVNVSLKDGVNLPVPAEKAEVTPAKRAHFKELTDDYQDSFPLEPVHMGWKSVEFIDVTDDFDNLVFTRKGLFSRRERRFMNGNLLVVNDHLSKDGLTFIKEGPTPLDYLGDVDSDFFIRGMNVFAVGWGFDRHDLNRHRTLTTYGSTILLWSGDEEAALSALHQYHNTIHVFNPDKDAFIMSNTWGDQSSDGRLSEQFLLEELGAAKRTGVTFYQIDDGWQNGTTANSVLPGGAWGKGYYKHNPDFWKVNDKRFPNGLEPIIASAEEKGIKMGLWFSPDSINDFENWEKDSQVLIKLHQKYGITAFKMDGIEFTSKAGEENLNRLLRRVLENTDRKVFFNMDVTAGTRSGYYGQLQYGSLFLENRFTGKFGAWPNYFQHCTLRNVWMLSRYYPTYRIQAEFLNVKRNAHLYEGDVLSPSACGLEYAFAITMFANPLAWMEQTGLDEESVRILERIVPKYREVQSDILAGHVLPIGEEPNGTVWTGFQSITSEKSGYLLVIKERNSGNAHDYRLWSLKNKQLQLDCILGTSKQIKASTDDKGYAAFELDGQFTYALFRYTVI
ncbi:alpha-galactosidase [Paenibacillus harenae]|uniref:alpha-galactosidase n=1 Tax=Paenibacillus harenae TaxID=306543 RepID=UPI0004180177|nr:alpha-galactosidase [Paenibacillus harenae]